MKKLLLVVLIICSMVLLTSCNNQADWQKAEHTYSLLGFTVNYDYPDGFNAVTSDDDPAICIYDDGIEDMLDWAVILEVSDKNHLEFNEFKGMCAESASNINQKDGLWIFEYKEPYDRLIILKWFECGKLLILQKANDFNYEDAFEIARTFEIDVWGEDAR